MITNTISYFKYKLYHIVTWNYKTRVFCNNIFYEYQVNGNYRILKYLDDGFIEMLPHVKVSNFQIF